MAHPRTDAMQRSTHAGTCRNDDWTTSVVGLGVAGGDEVRSG
jgi:hypothetical protein